VLKAERAASWASANDKSEVKAIKSRGTGSGVGGVPSRRGDAAGTGQARRNQRFWSSGWLRKAKPEEPAPELWVGLSRGLPSPAWVSSIYTVRFAGGAVLELPRGFNPEEAARLCRVLGQL
jgi:hypothetical protein